MRQYFRATVRDPLLVLVLLVTFGLLVGHHVGSAPHDTTAGVAVAHEPGHPVTAAVLARDVGHQAAEADGAVTATRPAADATQHGATFTDALLQEPHRGQMLHLHLLACLLALGLAVPVLRLPGFGVRPPQLSLDGPSAVAPRATTGRAVLLQRGVLRT